jgi:hypothetical protein
MFLERVEDDGENVGKHEELPSRGKDDRFVSKLRETQNLTDNAKSIRFGIEMTKNVLIHSIES